MNKEELLKAIEQKRQAIWPTYTGEMAPATVPTDLEQGWLNALKWMENLINSLPAGQPNNDVEEEINDYFEKHLEICNDNTLKCGGEEFDMYDLLNVIDYFTTWQKNQTINKACEWLQKHMNDYIVHGRDIDFLYDDLRKAMEDKQ